MARCALDSGASGLPSPDGSCLGQTNVLIARSWPHAPPARLPHRLLDAAIELFARRGFHGTTMRDIAERAGANVAAGHYHFGSKEASTSRCCARSSPRSAAQLERRGVARSRAPSSRARAAPRAGRAARGPHRDDARAAARAAAGPHGTLMLREMCDPSEALPIIVARVHRAADRARWSSSSRASPRAPDARRSSSASSASSARCSSTASPAVRCMLRGQNEYPRGFARKMARHITDVLAGAIDGMAAQAPEPRPCALSARVRAGGGLRRAAARVRSPAAGRCAHADAPRGRRRLERERRARELDAPRARGGRRSRRRDAGAARPAGAAPLTLADAPWRAPPAATAGSPRRASSWRSRAPRVAEARGRLLPHDRRAGATPGTRDAQTTQRRAPAERPAPGGVPPAVAIREQELGTAERHGHAAASI